MTSAIQARTEEDLRTVPLELQELTPEAFAPYGEVFFLATDRARLVAVARIGRPPLILSPARSREFVEAINSLRAQRALAELEPVASEL